MLTNVRNDQQPNMERVETGLNLIGCLRAGIQSFFNSHGPGSIQY